MPSAWKPLGLVRGETLAGPSAGSLNPGGARRLRSVDKCFLCVPDGLTVVHGS